jgi:hypothetical protein
VPWAHDAKPMLLARILPYAINDFPFSRVSVIFKDV